MQVSRADVRHSLVAFNLQVLIVNVVEQTDEVRIIKIKVKVVDVDASSTSERIIVIINNHQNIAHYLSMVDCLGISRVGAKGKRLRSHHRSNIHIHRVAQLAKRKDVLVELSHCQLAADLASARSGDLRDPMDGAVEGISFEEGAVLLGVDAVNGGIDVIDGPSLNKLPSLLDVVNDKD